VSTHPPAGNGALPAGDAVHPIEAESYRLVDERVDLAGFGEGPAAVARRVVHATADPTLVDSLVVSDAAVEAGVRALRAGAPVLCDVEMVRVALAIEAVCLLGQVASADDAAVPPTRSATAMRRALAVHPDGAVVVVGCAPSALAAVTQGITEAGLRPALVVGVPVGYVGAAQAKQALEEAGRASGVPVITLRGERGGAAVAAAVTNALLRLAAATSASQGSRTGPAMLVIGHGTRSPAGADELRRFAEAVGAARPRVSVGAGFIEFMTPGLDEAIDALVATGTDEVVAVPLVLLGAGHLKDDGPSALARARRRHPSVQFHYARDFGVHPSVLGVMTDRIRAADDAPDAVVVVGRGSSDPDANADLVKAVRLLADGRRLTTSGHQAEPEASGAPPLGAVEPAFVSLARPDVPTALERSFRLGARRIVVAPYFLFTGVLVERIEAQAADWAASHPGTEVTLAHHMGLDERLVELVWDRYEEVAHGPVHMNCDGCLYRAPLPGYEDRLGAPPFAQS
jgi:precorrin isomerase/sirohydrochlorin ferrochelatase